MGLYDEGTYGNQYTDEREDARQQLARKIAEREQKVQGYMADQQYAADTTWGDDMTKGAMMGSAFGPYGALIGAGAGALSGGSKAYGARRDKGEGRLEAFLNTAGDTFNEKGLGAVLDSPSAAPLAATLGSQYKQSMAQQSNPMNYSAYGNKEGETNFRFEPEDTTVQDLAAQGDPETGYGGQFDDPRTDQRITKPW